LLVEGAVKPREAFFEIFTEGTDNLSLRVAFFVEFLTPHHQLAACLGKLQVGSFHGRSASVFEANHLRFPLSVDCRNTHFKSFVKSMPTTLNKPSCLHRERKPVRACKSCGAYLTSANEDSYCFQDGGWTTQRLQALDALAEARLNHPTIRAAAGEVLEEMMVA
jgi:hypothetical protein